MGTIPSGALVDEASIGYNAFSIFKTGKDEHGVAYPLVFAAFGDQKLPAYIYAVVPFIKLLGLGNAAVRFPSVLSGSLLCCVIYFLLLKLGFSTKMSFLGGILTATSPWTILISRFGYESNLGLLFFAVGITAALYTYKNKSIALAMLSGVFFGATYYSYVAFKLISPFTICLLIGIYFRKKLKISLVGILLAFSFFVVILPQLIQSTSKQSLSRFFQINSTFKSGNIQIIDQRRYFCSQNLPNIWCSILSNKISSYISEYTKRYIAIFSPDFLFFTGDKEGERMNVDNFGVFYIFLLPFYMMGCVYYFNKMGKKQLSQNDIFILACLLIAPLPSLLVGEPHKLRLSGLFPFLLILILSGITQMNIYVKKYKGERLLFIYIVSLSMLFTLFFMTDFLIIQTRKYEESFGTYIPKLMSYLHKQDKKNQIYIRSITEGLIYYSYFNAVDPHIYQKEILFQAPDAIGFAHATDLNTIHITDKDIYAIGCALRNKNINALYVSNENITSIPKTAKHIIYSENGVDSLAVVYSLKKMNLNTIPCENK